MRLFDTHAHLSDEKFNEDRSTLIPKLYSGGIERIIDVACDTDELPLMLELVNTYDFIYGAAGIHPHYALDATNEKLDMIQKAFRENEKLVAYGELGLDYHYDFSPRNVQCDLFETQLQIAKELDKPVILHIREAFGDCMDILRKNKNGIKGVMHCYSGSREIAFECLDMGLFVAFGGSVTFKNATNLQEVAKALPLDRLLLETDCPYMTPVPHRGKRNDPSYMYLVAEKIAELKGITTEEVAQATFKNSLELFNIE